MKINNIHNFLSFQSTISKPLWYWARLCVSIVVGIFIVWIINQNFALTGVHRITISSFLHLPRSVQYVGGAEIGIVATPDGQRTRPYTDQVKLAVTLPRGFDTMTMTAEVDSDPYATLILGAKGLPSVNQAEVFRLPTAFENGWHSTTLDGGRLQLRNHGNIQNADAFWSAFETFRLVYTLSGDLVSAIPTNLYAKSVQVNDIRLASDYRGRLSISAYLDGRTKEIRFSKQDLNFVPGDDTLHFSLERGGKIIVSNEIGDDAGIIQDIVIPFPDLVGGFYTLLFSPNNEDSIVRNVQFRGIDALLQEGVFLGQVANPVALYTACPTFIAEAVHIQGLQSSFFINDQKTILKSVKKAQTVSFSGPLGKIVIPRGDVNLVSKCGFQLTPAQPIRDAFNILAKRIVPLREFTSASLKSAEAVFDDAKIAQAETKSSFIIEKKFDLHKLAAKGRTFTFSIESSSLTKREGAYLHIKKIIFTAKRQPFNWSDIRKAVKKFIAF